MIPVRSRRQQRGVALLVAILLVALATILAAGIAFQSAMAARRGTATLAFDQSLLVAEAAEALAAYALREELRSGSRQTHPAQAWAMPLGPVEVVPGIWLVAHLEDLQGRFNLNSLVDNTNQIDDEGVHELERLLTLAQVEPKWAGLIADWIDDNDLPHFPDGAEDSTYTGLDPPYHTANTFITSTSELLALPGFGRERYLKIAPYVAALPRDTFINVCSASGTLLDALNPLQSGSFSLDPKHLAQNREKGCFPRVTPDFQNTFNGDEKAWQPVQSRVSEDSRYFGLTSLVSIGTAEFTLYSLLQRQQQGGQVRVLMRTWPPCC